MLEKPPKSWQDFNFGQSMSYAVKEVFFTLQGEGARAGRAAVFCRFSGCNLWSGRQEDRANAICWFCDTDFVGTDGENGNRYLSARLLADKIEQIWRDRDCQRSRPYVVFTGGEPLLQLDTALLLEVKAKGFEVALETNGTSVAPKEVDWITVSPKSLAQLVQRQGHELKLLYPFIIQPEEVHDLHFDNFYLSPVTEIDPARSQSNLQLAIQYCLKNPQWRLSMQYHKIWNIP